MKNHDERAENAVPKALDIRLRAERRIGELLSERVDHAGGKRAALSNATLPDGIERMQSSRWQRIARPAD